MHVQVNCGNLGFQQQLAGKSKAPFLRLCASVAHFSLLMASVT
ncbi:MAG: hypothetical protein H6R46_995 [Proteobacteria bacterium]|nr:hypothetical protein [Pseudomonadota bacterium]